MNCRIEEKLRSYINNNFPQLQVSYVYNPKYDRTNYIYSLYLTKEIIDDDVILMHGDMVFENSVLKKLIESKYQNCTLINNKIKPPEKDFKGRIEDDIVKQIGVKVFGKKPQ